MQLETAKDSVEQLETAKNSGVARMVPSLPSLRAILVLRSIKLGAGIAGKDFR